MGKKITITPPVIEGEVCPVDLRFYGNELDRGKGFVLSVPKLRIVKDPRVDDEGNETPVEEYKNYESGRGQIIFQKIVADSFLKGKVSGEEFKEILEEIADKIENGYYNDSEE